MEHQIFRFAKAFTLCGRRGTWRHRPSLCVAGQALGWLWWRAWVPLSPDRRGRLCGRRGTWRHPVSCGVAGVALGDIDLHFVWQARHLVASTFTLCGRRGTWRHRPSLCVSGQALMALGWLWWHAWVPLSPWSPRLFVWQAWRLATSSGCFSGTFFGTLLNLTWLCTKASQTFSRTFSGTLLNLPLALRQNSQTFSRTFSGTLT